MKLILCVPVMTLLALSTHAAVPGDSAEGKRLHDASCTGCHDSSVYTRKDRRVRSLEALEQQVGDCTHMAQKEFAPAEMQHIVKYLNEQFYKLQ